MVLSQQIRFVGSFIVSDDTGQLMQLIQAISILVGILITLLRVVGPLLLMVQDVAVGIQIIGERIRYFWPYVPVGAG